MSKLKRIYNKIINRTKRVSGQGANNPTQHYDNIKESDEIKINGKTYLKIKLQFVDTLDPVTTNQIQILTSKNDYLQGIIEFYKKRELYYKETINQLNVLNKYILKENKTELSSAAKRNTELIIENKFLETKIKELKRIISENVLNLNEAKSEIKELQKEIFEFKRRTNKNTPVVNKSKTVPCNKSNIDIRITHLKEKYIKLEKELEIIKSELTQKNELIQILTNKIFEKELKINDLLKRK